MSDWIVQHGDPGWIDEEQLVRIADECEASILRRRVGLTVRETRLRAIRDLSDAEVFRVQTLLLMRHSLEATVVGRGDRVCRFYPRNYRQQQGEAIVRASHFA